MLSLKPYEIIGLVPIEVVDHLPEALSSYEWITPLLYGLMRMSRIVSRRCISNEVVSCKILEFLKQTNQVITTISGIGNVLSAIIIGKIGDISRFNSAPKFVAYAGLDVRVNQSGQFFLALIRRFLKKGLRI